MKFRWILLILFLSILTFQSKNILTFVGVELGVYFGFKELDKNSSGFIEREEWSEGMFSLLDFNRDNLASKEEFREFIKEFSKEFSWENELNDKYIYPSQLKKGSFQSTLMNTSIGYYIYIPDTYQEKPEKRFRTVYYLHGGRPGNEAREAFISHYVHEVFKNSSIDPAIYIFVNWEFAEMSEIQECSTFANCRNSRFCSTCLSCRVSPAYANLISELQKLTRVDANAISELEDMTLI